MTEDKLSFAPALTQTHRMINISKIKERQENCWSELWSYWIIILLYMCEVSVIIWLAAYRCSLRSTRISFESFSIKFLGHPKVQTRLDGRGILWGVQQQRLSASLMLTGQIHNELLECWWIRVSHFWKWTNTNGEQHLKGWGWISVHRSEGQTCSCWVHGTEQTSEIPQSPGGIWSFCFRFTLHLSPKQRLTLSCFLSFPPELSQLWDFMII